MIDLSLFDCVIESYAVGARKPEPAIYEATAAALGVEHAEIAYLDDFDQNLAPAEALGWTTIHVTDPVVALAELDRVLDLELTDASLRRRLRCRLPRSGQEHRR